MKLSQKSNFDKKSPKLLFKKLYYLNNLQISTTSSIYVPFKQSLSLYNKVYDILLKKNFKDVVKNNIHTLYDHKNLTEKNKIKLHSCIEKTTLYLEEYLFITFSKLFGKKFKKILMDNVKFSSILNKVHPKYNFTNMEKKIIKKINNEKSMIKKMRFLHPNVKRSILMYFSKSNDTFIINIKQKLNSIRQNGGSYNIGYNMEIAKRNMGRFFRPHLTKMQQNFSQINKNMNNQMNSILDSAKQDYKNYIDNRPLRSIDDMINYIRKNAPTVISNYDTIIKELNENYQILKEKHQKDKHYEDIKFYVKDFYLNILNLFKILFIKTTIANRFQNLPKLNEIDVNVFDPVKNQYEGRLNNIENKPHAIIQTLKLDLISFRKILNKFSSNTKM